MARRGNLLPVFASILQEIATPLRPQARAKRNRRLRGGTWRGAVAHWFAMT